MTEKGHTNNNDKNGPNFARLVTGKLKMGPNLLRIKHQQHLDLCLTWPQAQQGTCA